MALYLGSTLIDSGSSRKLYLGSQEICKAYLGSTLFFDNCGYVPVTVTMLYSGSPGGTGGSAGYTIGGPSSGSTQSGQAGVGTYSFTNTIRVNTSGGYSGTVWVGNSGNSTSTSTPVSNTLSGTIPSVNTTVYQTFGGSTSAPVTNQTDTYNISKDSSLTQGTVNVAINGGSGGTTDSINGAPGTSYNIVYTYTGASSGYNYSGVQISIGGASAVNMTNSSGNIWTYSDSSTITSKTVNATISGTETQQTTSRTITFDRDITGFGYQYASTSYSITGTFNVTAGSASGTLNSAANSASVTIEAPANTNINISFSSVSDGGYDFITSTTGTNCTDTTGVAYSSDAPGATTIGAISSNQTYNVVGCLRAVADTSYGYGPYLSLSSACSDRNNGQYGNSAEYNYYNGDEGVLPSSGVIGQAWSINNGITQELTNYRWYVTEDEQDSNGNNIVFYYFNGIQSATCP